MAIDDPQPQGEQATVVVGPAERRTPTLVAAHRVKPGKERAFRQWARHMAAAAEASPGFVHADCQPPDDAHPGEWVNVYRFGDEASLTAWMNSPRRAQLIAEREALTGGADRYQIVAIAPEDDGDGDQVTAVASAHVRDGQGAAYRAVQRDLLDAMRTFPGFLRGELFEPVEGLQEETVAVFSFESRHDLDRWLASPERAELLERVRPLVDGDVVVNVVGGFAGWFPHRAGGQPVRTWKQACAVLLALYPSTVLVTWVRLQLIPDAPSLLGTLIGNVVVTAMLTWLLMPHVTKLLAGWLKR